VSVRARFERLKRKKSIEYLRSHDQHEALQLLWIVTGAYRRIFYRVFKTLTLKTLQKQFLNKLFLPATPSLSSTTNKPHPNPPPVLTHYYQFNASFLGDPNKTGE